MLLFAHWFVQNIFFLPAFLKGRDSFPCLLMCRHTSNIAATGRLPANKSISNEHSNKSKVRADAGICCGGQISECLPAVSCSLCSNVRWEVCTKRSSATKIFRPDSGASGRRGLTERLSRLSGQHSPTLAFFPLYVKQIVAFGKNAGATRHPRDVAHARRDKPRRAACSGGLRIIRGP